MRRIAVPDPIALVHPVTGAPMRDREGREVPATTFQAWSLETWVNDPRGTGGGIDAIRRWMDVCKKVASLGGALVYLDLEDQDWVRAAEIVRSPGPSPYMPIADMQFLPFADAVLGAEKA